MQDLISDYPVVVDIPIAWGDMDAFQHLNNVVYFKYFESARIAYLEKIDAFIVMDTTGIGPILATTQCRYKIPLTYPDQVSVGARVDAIGKDRFTMTYTVVSHKFNRIAAQGEGVLVAFDYRNNQKAVVPDVIKASILSLEKGVGHILDTP